MVRADYGLTKHSMYAERTNIQTTEAIVSRNIAVRRAIVGMTQAQLGQMIGRDRDFVKRLESGQPVTLDVAKDLKIALKLSDVFVLLKPDAFI